MKQRSVICRKNHHVKSKYAKVLIPLYLALFLGTLAFPETRARFTHYSADDGLSQNRVMDILQDRNGYMWFATWDGLNRFDGRHFRVYKGEPGDPNGFDNNRVNEVQEDSFGYLWIRTNDRQVFRFNQVTERFQKLSYNEDKKAKIVRLPIIRVTILPGNEVFLKAISGCYLIQIKPDGKLGEIRYMNPRNNMLSGNDVRDVFKDKERNTWFLTERGITFISADKKKSQHFFHQFQNEMGFNAHMELNDRIFFGDESGQIWSWGKNIRRFRLETLKAKSSISGICSLSKNRMLIITLGDGMYLTDNSFKSVRHYFYPAYSTMVSNRINSYYRDKSGNVWLDVNAAGVGYFDSETEKLYYFKPKSDERLNLAQLQRNFFVVEDANRRIWVHPASGGFSEFDPVKKSLNPFYNDPNDPKRLFSNTMHNAFVDRQGDLWFSTRAPGLEKCTFFHSRFYFWRIPSLLQSSGGSEVRTTFEDHYKRIWVADKEGKIELFSADGKSLGFLSSGGSITQSTSVCGFMAYDIIEDRNHRIWLACKGSGIVMLEDQGNTGKSYKVHLLNNSVKGPYQANSKIFYALLQDSEGRIWAGSYDQGLNLIEESNGQFRFLHFGNGLNTYPYESCKCIRNLCQDNRGIIWVATTNGVLAFDSRFRDPSRIRFFEYRKNGLDASSIRINDVHCIHVDAAGNRWFGTFGGGLNRLDAGFRLGQKPVFKAYSQNEGLPSDIILSIEEDIEGNLWLFSENCISRFNTVNGKLDVYNRNDGIDAVTFSESSTCMLSNGNICAGTTNGFYKFNPTEVSISTFVPKLVFTRFFLFNKEVPVGVKGFPLTKNLNETDKIVLKHKQDVFTIEFAALDFRAPENIQYAYRLDPVDKDWINIKGQNSVSYSALSPGKYIFRVRSTNSEGYWMNNERTLQIVIRPPFWKTGWAVLIYVILGLSVFIVALYFFTTIYKLRSEVAVEQKVSELKMRFFTDMSHELRTPLTLISGPIEHMLQDNRLMAENRSDLTIVQRNIERMLRLINQLLDFRKVQDKKMQLRVEETPIGSLTAKIASNFEPTAKERMINFSFVDETNGMTLFLDRDKYDTIIYNLLSNAFKFTPGGKSVGITAVIEDDEAIITVSDEGTGIPEDKLYHLFERFYSFNQTSDIPGTGIGLNLVKELVDLHGGSIKVNSVVNKGSVFEVRFKLGTAHFEKKDNVIIKNESSTGIDVLPDNETKTEIAESGFDIEHQPLLLVVEDNAELRKFLTSVLSRKYRVADAPDGQAAWDMIGNLMPDFVISDLMMPLMDGLELTKKIKEDERTCHIPVIILTAKSDMDTRMEGLKAGVDDYITKPFSAAYLEARIENIFKQRTTLQEKFRQNLFSINAPGNVSTSGMQTQDSLFLKKIMDFMEENMSNSELTVDMLVSFAGMGRTVFFNKLKGLLGLSPIEFIKETRIRRAAQLLDSGKYNISEVSFQIGMNDARYFSKCFKHKFGMTPTEFKNRNVRGFVSKQPDDEDL